ncbi:glycosyltransferase [Kaistella sp. DKR-2]|uniref:glycosyltransferase n=1 Tax=Kaistella soli TaxID=2849654 RepID=UPI001C25C33B|nr:glycosyltransferase [Kaistella soli]MBU8883064.1 glycosyltransferase [Kaistella soli]
MKIFILIDQLHSHGGIEKLVAMKANYWTDTFGYEVKIISTEQNNLPPVYTLSEAVQWADLDVNYKRELSFFHPENLKKLWINKKRLLQIIKREKPDFILVASHIPMTYLLPFLKTGVPTIKEFHYSKFYQQRSFKERIFEAVEKYYDYLVVLSKEEKTFYTSPDTVVIPNPVIPTKQAVKPISERKNIAVAALRFAPVKQIEKMVEAWEIFHLQNPSWELHLFGETGNEYFEVIQEMVGRRKLSRTVLFKGQSDDIQRDFAASKVLLMTSGQECFPMVILEAQSCGVPVVSFDSPTGPRNIINHGKNGVLLELNNVHAFAQALHELVNNPESLIEMSEAAIQNAQEYNIDSVMDIWKNTIFEKKINA